MPTPYHTTLTATSHLTWHANSLMQPCYPLPLAMKGTDRIDHPQASEPMPALHPIHAHAHIQALHPINADTDMPL